MDKKYAGFWIRALAILIDGLIILSPMLVIDYLLFTLTGPDMSYVEYNFTETDVPLWTTYDTLSIISNILIGAVYYGVLTFKYRGTIGKLVIGLQVVGGNGEGISFGRAVGRYFAYMLSSILYIGYIMVAFSKKKQGLHDKICKTYVVYKQTPFKEPLN